MELNNYIPTQISIDYKPFNYDNKVYNVVNVAVTGEEYKLCEESANNMWASEKKGIWGNGYKNNVHDPKKVERTGRLGEMAFAKITNSPINLSYIKYGDNKDTIYKGKSVNIKTAFYLYGVMMVRCEMNGYPISLHEDLYVLSYLKNENRQDKIADIMFIGCIIKPELLKSKKVPRKNWVNYEIPYSNLHSMKELFDIK